MFPVPRSLGSVGLEVLASSGDSSAQGIELRVCLNLKMQPPCGHFEFPAPIEEQAQKGDVLAGVIDPDFHEEV